MRLLAIWWLAAATVPWRAMNSAISVNEVTSTITASAVGTPSRAKARSTFQSGRSTARQMRYGSYSECVRSAQAASATSR